MPHRAPKVAGLPHGWNKTVPTSAELYKGGRAIQIACKGGTKHASPPPPLPALGLSPGRLSPVQLRPPHIVNASRAPNGPSIDNRVGVLGPQMVRQLTTGPGR